MPVERREPAGWPVSAERAVYAARPVHVEVPVLAMRRGLAEQPVSAKRPDLVRAPVPVRPCPAPLSRPGAGPVVRVPRGPARRRAGCCKGRGRAGAWGARQAVRRRSPPRSAQPRRTQPQQAQPGQAESQQAQPRRTQPPRSPPRPPRRRPKQPPQASALPVRSRRRWVSPVLPPSTSAPRVPPAPPAGRTSGSPRSCSPHGWPRPRASAVAAERRLRARVNAAGTVHRIQPGSTARAKRQVRALEGRVRRRWCRGRGRTAGRGRSPGATRTRGSARTG
ncbi:hypothetical protein SAMN06272765_1328 [Streptomyces sp. Ag109_G2-15]|nr:hypothetical protein SAMN06272765_1328 [Streptomyces sp. Ag109_G2-15]